MTLLTRSGVSADAVAGLMRMGVLPATEAVEAAVLDGLGIAPATLAAARRRLLAEAITTEELPVGARRRCPDPTPEEWTWLGFRAPEFALWRCRLCGRPFHVRRHHEAHVAAAAGDSAGQVDGLARLP